MCPPTPVLTLRGRSLAPVVLDRRALRVLGVAHPPQVLLKVVLVQQVVPHFQQIVTRLRLVPQFPGGCVSPGYGRRFPRTPPRFSTCPRGTLCAPTVHLCHARRLGPTASVARSEMACTTIVLFLVL